MSVLTPVLDESRRTPRMSCAEATLRSFVDLGADTLFNIPGRGIYPLLNELPKFPELKYVTGLHEFPLASIADGYARVTGSAAFVNLYMSTGVLNAASAIFLAQRDRVPMVVTATQAESWAVGADHRAEISDIAAAGRTFTKWAWMPPTPDRVPEALHRAHTIATTPPCGPTFVAIPVDYWSAEVEYKGLHPATRPSYRVDPGSDLVAGIADELLGAERPCLIVGYEAIMAGLDRRMQAVASALGCPLIAEPEPAMLPSPIDFELFAGSVPEAAELLESSDVVLHVGANSYEAFHGKIFTAGCERRHLWIGSCASELNKVVAADVAAIGPVAPLADAVAQRVLDRAAVGLGQAVGRAAKVKLEIAEERAELMAASARDADVVPMSIARVCRELRLRLPSDTIVLDHSTTAVRLVRENFPVPSAQQYVSASGSCQGWGIGAAIGVALGNRAGAPVVAFVGDGGFMFGIQAIWSAVKYETPLLAVILDNGGWSSMRASLTRAAPAVIDSGLDLNFGWESDYAGIARGFGMRAFTVTTPDELTEALDRSLPLAGPVLLDARCRREAKTSRSPYVGY